MKKKGLKSFLTISFFVFSSIFLFSGCSSVKTLDEGINVPQVVVNPETIRLGVAKLAGTKIFFNGSGFKSGDSILVELLNVDVNGKKVDLAIANAQVSKDGTFIAEVGTVTKIIELMRAKIDVIKGIIIITGPPMPVGKYTARVSSLMSESKAECILNVEGPSLMDRFKDWLGVKLGKIVKK